MTSLSPSLTQRNKKRKEIEFGLGMCDCGYCTSAPVVWKGRSTCVTLPLAIRFDGREKGLFWATLTDFSKRSSKVVCNVPYKGESFLKTFDSLRKATQYCSLRLLGRKIEDSDVCESFWHFSTDGGDLPLSSLYDARISLSKRGCPSPPSSMCSSVPRMRRTTQEGRVGPKRRRIASSCASSLPPPSPDGIPPSCDRSSPYDMFSLCKSKEAKEVMQNLPFPWNGDAIVTLIIHGVKVPLVKLVGSLGRKGHVEGIFSLPDGSHSEKVYLHINHLVLLYKSQVKHLLTD